MAVQELAGEPRRIVEGGIGDLDGIALAPVADGRDLLHRHLPLTVPRRGQGSGEPGLQVRADTLQAPRVPLVHRHAQGALLRIAHPRTGATQRGEHAGMGGNDHPGDGEGAGQRHRVHGAGAAEGEERAAAAVHAALHRDPAKRPQHGRIGDPDHAQRRGLHAHAHGRCERRDGRPGGGEVHPDVPADDPVRSHVAQHQVGVAHRRPAAAAAVAGRPRIGAGALRADGQGTVIEPGDRAPAGPDGLHRDHGLAQGPAAQRAVARDPRLAVEDQADVGGGAAHVEADGVLDTEVPGDAPGRGDAGRGTRGGEAKRQLAQRLRRGHPAGGVEQVQPRIRRPGRFEPVEVARGQGHQAGAQRRRRGAFVLPRLRIDPVRERHEGEPLAQPLAQRLLVGGVGVGMQQRHRDRLGPALPDAPDRLLHRARVHRLQHPPFMIEPLPHLEAARGRHLGSGLGRKVETVEVAPVLAPDGQGVGEAPGGDQGDLGEIVLDDGVGHQGGAVDEVVHVRPRQIHRPERGQQAGHGVAGSGRHLGDPRLAARPVHGHHVRERAADVDSDPPSARHDHPLVR